MALLWIEGFEGFGTTVGGAPSPTGIIGRKYSGINGESGMDIETGRDGSGRCLEIIDGQAYVQSANLTTNATCVLGFALKLNAHPTNLARQVVGLYENATLGMNIRVGTNGSLNIYNGGTLLGASTNTLSIGTWHYIEFKVFTNNSTGTAEIKVDETSWLSITNSDTQPGTNAYHSAFKLQAVYGVWTQFDDLYFLDGSGTINNDFLGNRKVVRLDPSGAGADTNWTPGAGSNYAAVDDGGLSDEDTTYVETGTDTDQDLYAYDNLDAAVASVDGIQINTEARVTTGTMDLSTVIKSSTTTDSGSAKTITSTSYVTATRVAQTDPNTSAKWTPANLDAAQFGIKATT